MQGQEFHSLEALVKAKALMDMMDKLWAVTACKDRLTFYQFLCFMRSLPWVLLLE